MIAEAVDAALAIGWALLVWVVLLAGAATAAVYAGLVVGWGIWRVLVSAYAATGLRRPQEPAGAPQAPSRGSRDAGTPPRPSQAPSRPSWVRTDKEAA